MSNPQKDLLTSHDAADLIGIKFSTFRQRVNRGTLSMKPVAKLGGQWLWLRTDIEHYRRNNAC